MTKIFDRVSEAWSSWFDSLSAREKRLVGILFSALMIVLVGATLYIAASKINSKKVLLTSKQNQLSEIRAIEDEYRAAKEKNESIIQSIRSNNVSLLSFIPAIAARYGLVVKELNEQRRTMGKTSNVEISVKISLNELSMDKVSALIEALEGGENEGRVKVTRLKISTRPDKPDLLDLQMTVSTWKSA